MKQPAFNPAWSDALKALYAHDEREIWNPAIAKHIWHQYRNQLILYETIVGQYYPQASAEVSILDVGCAQATLALRLAEQGYAVTALDVRQEFLDYAKAKHTHGRIDFIAGNALETVLDKRFDMIFANQIIEHLVYPREFIRRLLAWLKPQGIAVVSTPNGRYVKSTLPSFSQLGDPSAYRHRQFSADGDGHFFAYDPRELAEIFAGLGLRYRLQLYETPWISGHMKLRYLHGKLPLRVLQALDKLTLSIPVLNRFSAHQMLFVIGRVAL